MDFNVENVVSERKFGEPVIDIQHNHIEVKTLQNGIMKLSIYLCLPASTKSNYGRGADTITAGKTDTIIHHSGVTSKQQR